MNNRIKELWNRSNHDEEVFAELIVQECMNTIAESREARQTAYYYRNRIAKHFGVKE
jgi:hypothetical protein